MHARIINLTAQSETQLTMWQEMFKNIGANQLTELGAIQITIVKIAPNKAVQMNVYPNKEIALEVSEKVKTRVSELGKLLKMEIKASKLVFNYNSLSHQ